MRLQIILSALSLALVGCNQTDDIPFYVLDNGLNMQDSEDDTRPPDTEDDGCEGHWLQVVGSGEMELGWQCLPTRPFFQTLGTETIQANIGVQNMTWNMEIEAADDGQVDMDVIVLEFDAFYKEGDWLERIFWDESRWSIVTNDGSEMTMIPQIMYETSLVVPIFPSDFGWEPAVSVPAGDTRVLTVTLDTRDLEFADGDSLTGSWDNYQTWESVETGVPRVATAHEEFPLLGTTYEIVDEVF